MSTTTDSNLQKAHNRYLALLQPIEDSLSKATLRQMSRVILAMLAVTNAANFSLFMVNLSQ